MKRWHGWTTEEQQFLTDNYEWIGDLWLAEMFNEKFPKPYPWTKKHIEKRRHYMKLKRTTEQEKILRWIACAANFSSKTWEKRGVLPEGAIRVWCGGRKYIKHNGKFVALGRLKTSAKPGQIARWVDNDYKAISQAEHARINNMQRAALPRELKQTIKTLNQLKKLVYGKKDSRPKRNTLRHN